MTWAAMSHPPNHRQRLADEVLADVVRSKPADAEFKSPVAWLLGPEMLGALKQFLLHSLYKGEFDTHDWMTATPVVYSVPAAEALPEEFWFDFIADIGDGQRAMYCMAAVLQDDVYMELSESRACMLPAVAGAQVPAGHIKLPRGRFTVVGGDTAYPVADYVNIDMRVRQPFTWAYRDLVAAGRMLDENGREISTADLYGTPGNHDYYDLLAGFGRLYRVPVADSMHQTRAARTHIVLPGFVAKQTASYAALQLPWDWQLWAIDPGERDIDYRQECFFRGCAPSNKMIVVTPSPSVVFGRVMASRGTFDSLYSLGLPQPCLQKNPPTTLLDGKPVNADWTTPLTDQQCRIDIAGDMHCYARYGGADDPTSSNYAAVVAGAGGAFFHSTATDYGEVPAQALYPAPATARREFAKRLFSPFTVFHNGLVGVVCFLLALILSAGSIRTDTRVATDMVLHGFGVHREAQWWHSTISSAPMPAAGWSQYSGAAALSAALLLAAGLMYLALRYVLLISRLVRQPLAQWPWLLRKMRRVPFGVQMQEGGFVFAWLLVIVGLVVPPVVSQLVEMPSAAVVLFQILFITELTAIVLGLLALAWVIGTEYLKPAEKWPITMLGACHALMQIILPLLMVRVGLARPQGLLLAAAAYVACAMLASQLHWRAHTAARWLVRRRCCRCASRPRRTNWLFATCWRHRSGDGLL
jgi:hypothetical protein